MAKSRDAFRTISEVADWLGIQAHVLRFWESKFTQVKPIKRAGGRRYYRPADMLLLGGIKKLLHDDGLTIKGVQKILREDGMSHVSDMSGPLDDESSAQIEEKEAQIATVPVAEPEPEEKGVVLSFEAPLAEEAETTALVEGSTPAPVEDVMHDIPAAAGEELPEAVDDEPTPILADAAVKKSKTVDDLPTTEDVAELYVETSEPVAAKETVQPKPESPSAEEAEPTDDATEKAADEPAKDADENLPAFLRRPLDPAPTESDDAPSDNIQAAPEPVEEIAPVAAPEPVVAKAPESSAPKPRVIDIAPFTAEADFDVSQSVLTSAYRLRRSNPKIAREIKPLLARLTTLRDSMAARRRGAEALAPKD